jgi:hypothetical protein
MRQTFEIGQNVTAIMDTKTLREGDRYQIAERVEEAASDGPFFTYYVVDETGERIYVRNAHILLQKA